MTPKEMFSDYPEEYHEILNQLWSKRLLAYSNDARGYYVPVNYLTKVIGF